jgi:hypothetical protein
MHGGFMDFPARALRWMNRESKKMRGDTACYPQNMGKAARAPGQRAHGIFQGRRHPLSGISIRFTRSNFLKQPRENHEIQQEIQV